MDRLYSYWTIAETRGETANALRLRVHCKILLQPDLKLRSGYIIGFSFRRLRQAGIYNSTERWLHLIADRAAIKTLLSFSSRAHWPGQLHLDLHTGHAEERPGGIWLRNTGVLVPQNTKETK